MDGRRNVSRIEMSEYQEAVGVMILILKLSLLSGGLKVKLCGEVDQRSIETVRMSKQM